MPLDFDIINRSSMFYCSTDGLSYNPVCRLDLSNLERKDKKMEVNDKICDRCGKRYSVANMRVTDEQGYYADKDCYLDNSTPIENYPKLYHSRADKKFVGREMDLCSECAGALKLFAGED